MAQLPTLTNLADLKLAPTKISRFLIAAMVISPFSACHVPSAAADPAKPVAPTVDVEVADQTPDKSVHTARFALVMTNGEAQIRTRDGDAMYDVEAHALPTTEARYSLKLKRNDRADTGDLEIWGAIPQERGQRVLVAKIDRADGRTTSVLAQVR